MATPTLTPNSRKEQDDAYSPETLSQREATAFNDIENNYDKTADDSSENENIARAENDAGGWKNSVQGNQPQKTDWKAVAKKKGPIGGIIALLLGGGAGIGFFFSPGLVAFHFTETLTEDLNDQVAAADIRTDQVLRTKINGMTASAGFCSNTVNIRCKFGSMTKYQVSNFEKAGFKLDCNGNPCDRIIGNKLTTITMPNGRVISSPNQLIGLSGTDHTVRTDLKRAFNPVYRMMSDKVANNRFAKWGGKVNKFIGTKNDQLHKKLYTSAELEASKYGKVTSAERDGNTVYVDESNGQVVDSVTNPDEASKHNETVDKLNNSGGLGKNASNLLKGAGILGAADITCSGYNMYRSITFGAKVIRAESLAKLATTHHALVQAAKAGDETVTPEQMSMIGESLTETDTRKEITDPNGNGEQKIPNPNYGRSAMDSAFYKTAAHGDVPNLQPESLQYMVGGGAVGSFQELGSMFRKKPQGCKWIQHPITRGVTAVVSIALGIGSGGTTLAASAALSVSAAFAMSYLEGMLTDMLAGNVVTEEDTKATQYGDAMFSGTSVMLGSIAKGRGLRPLTEENIAAYMNTSTEVAAKNTSMERTLAKSTPFDISNQYSFLGSFARSTLPATTSVQGMSGSSINTIARLIPQSITSFIPTSSALDNDKGRFTKCDDPDYQELKIAADVACNVRYGLTSKELALDPNAVVDFMLAGGHISDDGSPKGSEYTEFLEKCVNNPYSVFGGEGKESEDEVVKGWEQCVVDGPNDIYNYFRVYTLDNSIVESMDAPAESPVEASGGSGQLVGGVSLPVPEKFFASNRNWFTKPHHDYPSADIPVPTGTEIYAVVSGKVTKAPITTQDRSYGQGVEILGEDGNTYIYAHGIDGGAIDGARVGDQVKAGQLIMHSGNTGNSTGPHLHFEIKVGGARVCPQTLLEAIGSKSASIPVVSSLPRSGCSY